MIFSESYGYFHATPLTVFVIIMRWLAGGGDTHTRLFFEKYLIKNFERSLAEFFKSGSG
jgi:hypothetical protein